MIDYDNEHEEMTMVCDFCNVDVELQGTWPECLAEAKTDGWKIFKDECDDWTHKCPKCAGKKENATEVFK